MKTLEEVFETWEAVIGLEIHAELTTLETKMFCGCKLEFGAAPNTHTCPVCLGLPGALPVPNKAAIESIVLAGLATNCDIEKHSMFYRKNYMYPDMAKNFQTTQGPVAFCMRGWLDLDVDGPAARYATEHGLSAYDARHLVDHRATADCFDACMALAAAEGDGSRFAKPLANLIINDVTAYMNAQEGFDLVESPLTPERAMELVRLVASDAVSSKQAKEVFAAVIADDADPAAIVEARGMRQVSDTGAIEAVVDEVLSANPDKVEQYRGGKTGLLGFFVGQCMKAMRGQGNPKVINELLAAKLDA